MRSIRTERVDKEMVSPCTNPFIVSATEDANLGFGDIRYVDVGIRYYFPDDIVPNVEMLIPGLVCLGKSQGAVDGALNLIVICCAVKVTIGRMQQVAKITLHKMEAEHVRFVQFDDGKRMVFGGAEKCK